MSQIKTANITFDENGAPFSPDFNDIYFDTSKGCSQSEQVFIENNNIPDVWQNFNEAEFVIVETGFGSGLNFLLTLHKFSHFKQQHSSSLKVHFISTEKYPMKSEDLQQSLSLWPKLANLSNELLRQYKVNVHQQTLCFCQGDVKLTLLFNDATQGLSEYIEEHNLHAKRFVDAFFLDGFAPSRNPEMWNAALFTQLATMAKHNASLGTFTVAGFVRRGLIDVGFKAVKQKHATELDQEKTESIKARFIGLRQGKPLNGFKVRRKTESSQHATIIGGGLASACAALSLAKKGIKVVVLCKDHTIAQGASSNAIGAVYPLLHQTRDSISEFYQQGFECSLALFNQLLNDGYSFSHGFNGLIDVCYKEPLQKRLLKFSQLATWPTDLIRPITAEQVNLESGIGVNYPGLLMPRAGWVSPPELVAAILQAAKDTGNVKVKTQRQLLSVKSIADDRWLITTNKGQKQVQNLIFCTGADSLGIEALNELPLSLVRGQVSQVETNKHISALKTVLCHKGYLTPANNGLHCIGATFDKDDDNIEQRRQDDQYNLDMLKSCLGDLGKWQVENVKSSKARLRCCTPDHLPMVGRLPNIALHTHTYQHLGKDKNWHYDEPAPLKNGLYVLTGLGARGLCSAPLLAEILAAEICNDDYPVTEEMLFNLSPNRFIIRDIIKSK